MVPFSAFVISLDFELGWGVKADGPHHPYWSNLLGARAAVKRLLELFAKRQIHATWATVGFLFAQNREEQKLAFPKLRPKYARAEFDNYRVQTGISEADDPLHFAASLVERISQTPGQELASHTFSHYYCNEPNQDMDCFAADLAAAQALARNKGLILQSLVFPRNQVRSDYLPMLKKSGFEIYRGKPSGIPYDDTKSGIRRHINRGFRFFDYFVNLTGHHTITWESVRRNRPHNVPVSQFLRPLSRRFALLEPLRRYRITSGLCAAASRNEIYHLWWHPHNFGRDLEGNLRALNFILDVFEGLRESHGMRSMTMFEVAEFAKTI